MTHRFQTFYFTVFLCAGAPALIYQVVWQRLLKMYFGVDVYSTSIIVGAFMLGLGVGALLGGRLADRARRPSTIYALVETLLGMFGFVSVALFSAVGREFAGASIGVLAVVTFSMLLIPTTLMGLTLPLMCRIITQRDSVIGHRIATLYAVNTLGAAVGAILSAYLLIGLLGLEGAARAASLVNVALGILVFAIASRRTTPPEPSAERAAPLPQPQLGYTEVLILSALSGAVALGYEVAWYRVLGIVLKGTVYVFGTVLFFYLVGIAIGSLAAQRRIDQPGSARRFALSQLAIGAWSLGVFTVLGHLSWLPGLRHLLSASTFTGLHPAPELFAGEISVVSLYSAFDMVFWSVLILLVPTTAMGYGFPNLIREASRSVSVLGRSVGTVYFANIVGATLGSIAVGFFGLEILGVGQVLAVLTTAGCAIALYVFVRLQVARQASRPVAWAGAAIAVAAINVALFPPPEQIMRAIHFADQPGVDFVVSQSRSGVAALRRQSEIIAFPQEKQVLGHWRLLIDGATHGDLGDDLDQIPPEELLDLALDAHPSPRRVLSIGLGDGVMCAAAVAHPRVESVTIIELNGSLRDVLEQTACGRLIFSSPKTRYVVDDGRRWLLANRGERFDVVTMWPLHAAHAYYGMLYSREFLAQIRQQLDPPGMLYTKSADAFSTARTIAQSFPFVLRFDAGVYVACVEMLRFPSDLVQRERTGILARLQADRETILEQTHGCALNTDLTPNSEYFVTYRHARFLGTWGRDRNVYRFSEQQWRDSVDSMQFGGPATQPLGD